MASAEIVTQTYDYLEKEFPKKVVVLQAGGFLYHRSRSPETLAREGFNPSRSHAGGAFYFSDKLSVRSNCEIKIKQDLILFNYNLISDSDTEFLESFGRGNYWTGLFIKGFDGRSFYTADPYVEIEDGSHANEVVIFRNSLNKLGEIKQLEK